MAGDPATREPQCERLRSIPQRPYPGARYAMTTHNKGGAAELEHMDLKTPPALT